MFNTYKIPLNIIGQMILLSEVWDWSESYKVTLICSRLYSFLKKFETGELQIPLIKMDDFQSKKLKCHLTFSGCYSAAVTSNNRGLFFRDSQ